MVSTPVGRRVRTGIALAALAATAFCGPAFAACPVDPALLGSQIQSADLDNRFGVVPVPEKPLKFAYVTQLLEDPFWTEVIGGLNAEAKRLGVGISVTAPKNRLSDNEQVAVAEAALATNPDVLILTPINAQTLAGVIAKAKDRNIPTISINLKTDGVRTHIGTNHESLGAAAAEFLHEYFPGGAAVGQLEGEVKSPYRIDRVKGFAQGLRDFPSLQLAVSRSADWDETKAYDATLAMMAERPDIKGIYANSDLMAVGAVSALDKLGRPDVVVVGTDGVIQAKQSIGAGRLKGTTAQFPAKEGILAIQTGIRLVACQPVPGWIVSPQSVITAKSLGDYAARP